MQHSLHDAVSSSCVLYSFTMIVLGLEILVRVVYLAGYRLALSISETVVLLYSSLSRIECILNTRVVYLKMKEYSSGMSGSSELCDS